MKNMLRKMAICLTLGFAVAGALVAAHPSAQAGGRSRVDRLSRQSSHGKIAMKAGGKHFPGSAKISFARTHSEKAKGELVDGLAKKWRGRHGGKRHAKAPSPRVLAMYDVSIDEGGRKWQPKAGEPVRVEMELDEPVQVTAASSLGVVHLADDGTVEELEASRYGFTYNKDKSAVTAFWFSATGFSVYAITEGETHQTDSTPARRLYDFYSLDFNRYLEDGVTSNTTYNTYVPRYFKTIEGNYTFRQIVTNNQFLVRPEALPSPLGRTFMGWYLYSTNNANKTVDGIAYDADGYAATPFDFENPVVFNDGETGEHEYVLRSQFDRVGYVIFHEQPVAGAWPITAVRRGVMEEVETNVMQTSVEISDLKVTYDDTQDENSTHENKTPRMIFRGWSEVQVMPGATTDVTGGVIRILSSPYTFRRTKDTAATPRHLFPVFVNINWLTFKAAPTGEGATYIPPRFYYADEGTNRFPVPVRTGYTFNGWWTTSNDVAGVTGVRVSNDDGSLNTSANLSGWDGYIKNGNLMLNENATLYGRWTPAMSSYVVVILKQSVNDDKDAAAADKTYDFYASYRIPALTESTGTVANVYKQYVTTDADNFKGFWYRTCDGDILAASNRIVKADGSTILNVYYDRSKVEYTFNVYGYVYTPSTSTTAGYYYITEDGETYEQVYLYYYNGAWYREREYSWGSYYYSNQYTGTRYTRSNGRSWHSDTSMTGLYGQRIAKYGYAWPVAYAWKEEYSGSSASGTAMTYLDAFNSIAEHTTVNSSTHTITKPFYRSGENGSAKIYHIMQDVNGVYSMDNAVETLSSVDSGTSMNFNFTDKFEGFKVYAYSLGSFTANPVNLVKDGDQESTDGKDLYVYHERRKYDLIFLDSDNETPYKTNSVYYGASLAGMAPSAKPVPTDPSKQKGWSFTGWYNDRTTAVRFNFDTTMPMANVRVYAGWETEWYLIQIDPNGGQLADGQSLWFWEAYQGDVIEEYSTVTRSFEENVNGTYFYAVQDRAHYGYSDEWVGGEASERGAYYTTDQSDTAIKDIDKRYTPVVNAFRYAGWYEVMPDGSEELYAFGEPVQRNTKLKLHWKHLGTYRLHYDPGAGTMVERDENEDTFKLLDSGIYADSSELLVTRTAEPPEGYSFAGWRIRYGDGTVYHPGQSFVFNAAYAVNVPGPDGRPVKQLILDAVYSQVGTVSLTADANGGVIYDPSVAVTLPLAYPNAPTLITNITDTTRTVSGMRNNAYGHLSNGDGYRCVVKDAEGNDVELDFLGWNTRADGTGTHFDPGAYVGVDTVDALNGANVLYAEWAVPVYFDKNNEEIEWSHDVWRAKWGDKYVFVTNRNQYCQTTTLNGYATYPNIVRDSSTEQKMFAFWSTERYKDDSLLTPFDFENTPITGPTVLYAIWTDFIEVPYHPVDASGATPVVREDWFKEVSEGVTNRVIRIGNETDVSFDDNHADYVTPTGCIYAYACLADSVEHISEKTRISRLYYDLSALTTYVEYPDGSTGPIPSDKEIYFVYFTGDKPVDIGYRVMGTNGVFEAKTPAANGPTSVTIGTDATNMASFVTAPNTYVTGHDHYAFAIGETNATSASQLRIITPAKERDNDRPQLQIRNTWRGFEYSLDGGETWGLYGHNAQLYVLYFDSTPTIVNLSERTIGTEDDMTNKFEYVVVVTQVVTRVETKQTRTWTGGKEQDRVDTGRNASRIYGPFSYNNKNYCFKTDSGWTTTSGPSVVSTAPSFLSATTNLLVNSQAETFTLFYTSSESESTSATQSPTSGSNITRTETKTIIENRTTQVLVITQRPMGGFATSNDTGDGEYVYTQTSAATNATYNVTYTNTRESLPVELHVAFAQNAAIDHVDNAWRTLTEADYTLTVPLSEEGEFLADALEKTNVLLRAEATGRRFLGAYYGTAVESDLADENKVSLVGPVTSIGFVKDPNADWYRLCFNGDANLALGDYKIYYVYGEIPSIRYMKEGANGALTEIPTLTYVGNAVKMNGYEASQGEALDVPMDGTALTVGAGGTPDFRVPLSLDGASQASLNYYALAAGPAGTAATNAMDGVTWGVSLRLKVSGGLLKWSVDGETWGDFSGTAASIYAIYKEKGYDLTIAVDSLAADADKARDVFTVTVASSNLLVGTDYVVSGYAPGGTPIDTVKATACDAGGMLTFTVTGGSRVVIQSMQNNDLTYTLRELLPSSDYALTNLLVNNAAPLAQVQVANGTVTYMDMDKVVAFTNVKCYDVAFVDEDGETALKAATPYWYGTAAADIAAPADPSKAMDGKNLYRFAAWTPSVEDVASNTVYRAAYRAYAIPHATQRVADTNLVVTLPDDTLIATLGSLGIDIFADDYDPDAANAALNARDPNGLRRWENLVTGTGTNTLVLASGAGTCPATMTLGLFTPPGEATDLGYTVLHELRKNKAGGGWERVAGPQEGLNPSFSIDLLDQEGKSLGAGGFYRIVKLLVPNHDLSITNEIPSTNIIGVLEVNSSWTNTMTAVPWSALAHDPAVVSNIVVRDYMKPAQLAAGDTLHAITDDGVYQKYTVSESGAWNAAEATVTETRTVATPPAGERELSRGSSVWVTRKDPSRPFFLIGQYSGEDVVVSIGGTADGSIASTMVPNPSSSPLKVNDMDWGTNPTSDDVIWIPTEKATPTALRWKKDPADGKMKWGILAQDRKTRKSVLTSSWSVPAGMGFWYNRKGGAFTVTVQVDKVEQ